MFQNEKGVGFVNIIEVEPEEKIEGKVALFSKNTEKERGNITEGEEGEQNCQERNKNTLKIWKRVVRSGEEENISEGSNHVLLGEKERRNRRVDW